MTKAVDLETFFFKTVPVTFNEEVYVSIPKEVKKDSLKICIESVTGHHYTITNRQLSFFDRGIGISTDHLPVGGYILSIYSSK